MTAPRTCENFRKLCKSGFYNGTLFHRVIPGYIVQAGDPLSKEPAKKGMWGTGGPGYTLTPEFGLPHVRGAIAMARLGDAVNPGKESSGSQFYVALDRIESLDGEYTVFGKVISGLEVMDQIGEAAADQGNSPIDEIVIRKTTVIGETNAPVVPMLEPAPNPPISRAEPEPIAPVAPAGMPTAPARDISEQPITDITPPTPTDPNLTTSFPKTEGKSEKPPKKQGPITKFLKRFW